jgi:hypothetical protein
LLLAEPHAPTLCGGITRALLVERCRTQVDETLRHILSPEETGAGAPRRRQPAVQNKAGLAGINRIAPGRRISTELVDNPVEKSPPKQVKWEQILESLVIA